MCTVKRIWYSLKGHILYIEKDKGTKVIYLWFDLLNIDIPWLGIKELVIPSNVGYLATAYVLRQYRGRHLLKRGVKFMEKYLLNNTRVDKVFAITSPDNAAMNKTLSSLDYIPYQFIKYYNLLGVRFYLVESLEDRKPRIKTVFIQNSKCWCAFSPILKRS